VNFSDSGVEALMTRNPRVIGDDRLAVEAVEEMERRRINGLLVVDADGRLVGALNMHDMLRAKVV
jgi:arabinose-5-phosphate isomerase